MHRYRPPRAGDLLAVRTDDPHYDEAQVVIAAVVDTGATLLITGDWRGRTLEVLLRRVGEITLQPVPEH